MELSSVEVEQSSGYQDVYVDSYVVGSEASDFFPDMNNTAAWPHFSR